MSKTLENEVPSENKEKIQQKLYNELPDKTAFEDLDVVQTSISAPTGHGKNAAKNEGTLRKKRSSKSDKFTSILHKFMGF